MFTNFLKKRPHRIQWQVEQIDLSYVNSVRRILLAEIPNVGIAFDPQSDKNEDMNIHVNTSSLHNEFLAHRISLLPICFSENELYMFDPSKYTFRLKKHNTSHHVMNVTSHDIEIYDENGNKYDDAFHRRIFPAHPITKDYMLITKLKPNHYNPEKGEQIDITFKASVGTGKQHSRWCPVSTVLMNNVVDDEAVERAWKDKVAKLEAADGHLSEDAKQMAHKRFMSLEAYRHFKKNAYDEANVFNFGIRSICALRPEYLFFKAFVVLANKVRDFQKNVTDESNNVSISPMGEIPNFYEIAIQNEDFTLVNVLQCITYNKCFREKLDERLSYIGYHDPHPLDPKMVLKVKFKEDTKVSESDLRSFLGQACSWILNDIDGYVKAWIDASGLKEMKIKEVDDYDKTHE